MGTLFDCLVNSFHQIPLSRKSECKSYKISCCAYEIGVTITDSKGDYSLRIFFESQIVTDVSLFKNNFFAPKRIPLPVSLNELNYKFKTVASKIEYIAELVKKKMDMILYN